MKQEMQVAEFVKNQRERVIASLREFNNHKLADLRVHYRTATGEYRPGPKGLCLNIVLLGDLAAAVEALRKAVSGELTEATENIDRALEAGGEE